VCVCARVCRHAYVCICVGIALSDCLVSASYEHLYVSVSDRRDLVKKLFYVHLYDLKDTDWIKFFDKVLFIRNRHILNGGTHTIFITVTLMMIHKKYSLQPPK